MWGKPPWSRRSVRPWCRQEWEWKGFTQRRSGKEAGELASMWSHWQGRGVTCPESGSKDVNLIIPTKWPPRFCHDFFCCCNIGLILTYRNAGASSLARREYTVGQYVVDLPSFESLALPLFRHVRRWRTLSELITRSQWAKHFPSPHLTNHQSSESLTSDGIIGSFQTHKFQSDIFSVHGAVWLSLTAINPASKVSQESRPQTGCKGGFECLAGIDYAFISPKASV